MLGTRKSAAEDVYDSLRQMILRGELAGGQNLRAAALQKEFGFGATPLREALSRLMAEHLVVNAYQQGFRVAPVSLQELDDLDRTRLLLERDMLAASIRQGDEDWEGRIVASHYQLGKHEVPGIGAAPDQIDQWEARHDAFHAALISASGSFWMAQLLDQIETQRRRYHRYIQRQAVQISAGQTAGINDQMHTALCLATHTPLMQAVLDRDETAACQLLTDHIRLTSDVYSAIQTLLPPDPDPRSHDHER